MPTVQRNGGPVTRSQKSNAAVASTLAMDPPMRFSRPRPSPYLLLVYPIVLAAGSLYSILSPNAASSTPSPLAPGLASDLNTPQTTPAASYFAGKRNIVNLYFVKLGWFWTTLAFTLLHFTTRPPPSNKRKHYLQTVIRWILVTTSWFLTTQWFFGAALIDRSFTLTGGRCEPRAANVEGVKDAVDVALISSSLACKAAGGRWKGGHDISGHVFMLVLSSAFLLYELYVADRHSSHPSVSPRAAATLAHEMTEEEKQAVGGWESETLAQIRVWSRYFLYAVVVLDFWMLMMTAIWFHTWLEKLSGLLLAAATVWTVFFLGDFVPSWRAIVGS